MFSPKTKKKKMYFLATLAIEVGHIFPNTNYNVKFVDASKTFTIIIFSYQNLVG